MEQTMAIDGPDAEIGVLCKRPDGDGPFPVIVMFHDGPGVRDATHGPARALADAGFFVVVHDRYNREGRFVSFDLGKIMAEGMESEEAKRFFGVVTGTTDEMVRADLDAVLAHVEGDPCARDGAMGCIGYCIGARNVLRTMADRPDTFVAGVGLHPSFCVTPEPDSPHLSVPGIPGAIFVGIGEADHMSSLEENQPLVDAVRALGARGTVETYPGADHGFTMEGPTYDRAASEQSTATATALFQKALVGSGA
jgi:carboxymethylenebutenolidase